MTNKSSLTGADDLDVRSQCYTRLDSIPHKILHLSLDPTNFIVDEHMVDIIDHEIGYYNMEPTVSLTFLW